MGTSARCRFNDVAFTCTYNEKPSRSKIFPAFDRSAKIHDKHCVVSHRCVRALSSTSSDQEFRRSARRSTTSERSPCSQSLSTSTTSRRGMLDDYPVIKCSSKSNLAKK